MNEEPPAPIITPEQVARAESLGEAMEKLMAGVGTGWIVIYSPVDATVLGRTTMLCSMPPFEAATVLMESAFKLMAKAMGAMEDANRSTKH